MSPVIQSPNPQAKVSVIIPVKNGGKRFVEVLDRVLAQQTPWPWELLIIDSGSKDGSVELARERGVWVHEIAPSAFGHGRTRNLGASLTQGPFIAFLTHDALPTDNHWLVNFVTALEGCPDAAGAFGRHVAYPEHYPPLARDMDLFFQGFLQNNPTRMTNRILYDADVGLRQFMHFFSSNNALLRRSVWEVIPLPDVHFAEDQRWAKAVIEAGYARLYVPNACVYHSHDLNIFESYRRAFDEAKSFEQSFGYRVLAKFSDVLRQWVRLCVCDWRWLGEAPLPWRVRLGWRRRMPLRVLAKLLGLYVGTHWDRLPRWLTTRSSRDEALKKS